jgi:hypothetical protein
VQALMKEALMRADVPFDRTAKNRIVIKSVSAKQRPRVPRRQPRDTADHR